MLFVSYNNNNVHFNAIIRLARVANFCFNFCSPFLLIVCILSFQGIFFQILLYAHFHNVLDWPFFLFPVISSSITSHIWELCLNRWHDHATTDSFALSHLQSSQQHPPYLKKHQSTTINQSHPHIILIIQCFTSYYLASYATVSSHVSQQYNKPGLTWH